MPLTAVTLTAKLAACWFVVAIAALVCVEVMAAEAMSVVGVLPNAADVTADTVLTVVTVETVVTVASVCELANDVIQGTKSARDNRETACTVPPVKPVEMRHLMNRYIVFPRNVRLALAAMVVAAFMAVAAANVADVDASYI